MEHPDTASIVNQNKECAQQTDVSKSASEAAGRTIPIAITFCYRRGRTRIYKSVVTALGNPEYMRMLIHPEKRILLLQVCDQRDRDAIKIPKNISRARAEFSINSVAFLESITTLMNWSKKLTYRVDGSIENDCLMFEMDKAKVVKETESGD